MAMTRWLGESFMYSQNVDKNKKAYLSYKITGFSEYTYKPDEPINNEIVDV